MNDGKPRPRNPVRVAARQGAVAEFKLGLGYVLCSEGKREGVAPLLPKQWGVACRHQFALMVNRKMRNVILRCFDVVLYGEVNETVLAFSHFHGPPFWVLAHIGGRHRFFACQGQRWRGKNRRNKTAQNERFCFHDWELAGVVGCVVKSVWGGLFV